MEIDEKVIATVARMYKNGLFENDQDTVNITQLMQQNLNSVEEPYFGCTTELTYILMKISRSTHELLDLDFNRTIAVNRLLHIGERLKEAVSVNSGKMICLNAILDAYKLLDYVNYVLKEIVTTTLDKETNTIHIKYGWNDEIRTFPIKLNHSFPTCVSIFNSSMSMDEWLHIKTGIDTNVYNGVHLYDYDAYVFYKKSDNPITIHVPKRVVGLVIGTKGVNLSRIRSNNNITKKIIVKGVKDE